MFDVLSGAVGDVRVMSTSGRGFTPEELAEPALDKIIFVGSQLHPAIRDQADDLALLADLDVPTLVMVGEVDLPFIEQSRAMAGTIPGATLAIIETAGHSPQFEAPDAWAAVMTTFLASIDAVEGSAV